LINLGRKRFEANVRKFLDLFHIATKKKKKKAHKIEEKKNKKYPSLTNGVQFR
jgi:hypothetical protein